MNITEHKILLKEVHVNYAKAGAGAPMIFLHNGGGFWQSWRKQMSYFSSEYTVYGVDWPGFGESEASNEMISLNFLTSVLEEFIRKNELSNIVLIGNCIGGSVALQYNQLHPSNVSRLVLFNICPGEMIFRVAFIKNYLRKMGRPEKVKSKIRMNRVLTFMFTNTPIKRSFPRILFGKETDKKSELYIKYKEKFKTSKQTISRINLLYSAHSFNLNEYLSEKEVPKHLLFWGDHNIVTPWKSHGLYHYKKLQSSHCELIEDGGHLCMYEKATEVNRIIDRYLKLPIEK